MESESVLAARNPPSQEDNLCFFGKKRERETHAPTLSTLRSRRVRSSTQHLVTKAEKKRYAYARTCVVKNISIYLFIYLVASREAQLSETVIVNFCFNVWFVTGGVGGWWCGAIVCVKCDVRTRVKGVGWLCVWCSTLLLLLRPLLPPCWTNLQG